MSTQANVYSPRLRPMPRISSIQVGVNQEEVPTEELDVLAQSHIRPSLVDAWLKALQAAEALHLCLHPSYLRHTESELVSLVQAALHGRRDASQLVSDLLAPSAPGAKQTGTA